MADGNHTSRRDLLKLAAAGAALIAGGSAAAEEAKKEGDAAAPQLLPKVPRKTLGKTGQQIPILLMGGARKFDEKYDKVLHRGFKEGVDYIDTALAYADGQSHATVATFVEQVGRKNVWLTSKSPSKGATVASFTKDMDTCLAQLKVDHLDLFFMHAVNDVAFLEPEFIKMGDALKKSGKTRFFGLSCHGGDQIAVMNKAAQVGGIDAIMFRYNFAKYGDLELNKAIDACKKAGIGLIAMKTQKSVPAKNEKVVAFQSKQFTLGQAKLKAVWADERIDSAVSHMENTTQLTENVTAAKSPVELTMNEFQQLQRLATATAHMHCEGCNHLCEPHVEAETAVADTLRYLMYAESYRDPSRARGLYQRLAHSQRRIDGIDFTKAAKACPMGIDIGERLALAAKMLG